MSAIIGGLPRCGLRLRRRHSSGGFIEDASFDFHDLDALRPEPALEAVDRVVGIDLPAHEQIHRGILEFRPRVDAQVRFLDDRHTGYAVVRRELMQANFEESGPASFDSVSQDVLDTLERRPPNTLPQLKQQMRASEIEVGTFRKDRGTRSLRGLFRHRHLCDNNESVNNQQRTFINFHLSASAPVVNNFFTKN